MSKKENAKRQLLYSMGTLDHFKNMVFDEDSINFMLLQKILDNLMEVYNYVDYGSRENS